VEAMSQFFAKKTLKNRNQRRYYQAMQMGAYKDKVEDIEKDEETRQLEVRRTVECNVQLSAVTSNNLDYNFDHI
jgi:hypothetical protein